MYPAFPRIVLYLALFQVGVSALAQAPAPPPPAKYQALIRYRIVSPRDPHVQQYDALIKHLQGLGFEFQPPLDQHDPTDRENSGKNRLAGLIDSAKAFKILQNPSVAGLLLMPAGMKLPEPDQPVRVRIELASGFAVERQRDLADQTKLILQVMGFREAVAYDHRGHSGRALSRLTGTIPAGRLETLLKDIRGQPAGWFGPKMAFLDLPMPLGMANPIVLTEVLADGDPGKEGASPPPPRDPEFLEKLSPDLWALVQDKDKEETPVRVQMVLIGAPAGQERREDEWRAIAPGIVWEGQLGQVISIVVPVGQIKFLASVPEVSVIRLPAPARIDIDPALSKPGDPKKALQLSGLAELHAKGHRGKDVRLGLIDTDFRGWENLVSEGKLNKKTRLIDLTPERKPQQAEEKGALGHGAHCALAAAVAAPDAELTLIKIDALDPLQTQEAAAYCRGGELSSDLQRRQDALTAERAVLENERRRILLDRAILQEDFTDETEQIQNYGFLGPIRGWLLSQREWLRHRLAHQERLEEDWAQRKKRLESLLDSVRALKGIRLVASPLGWNDGYPLGGGSPLSRYLDVEAAKDLTWFQAAGNTRGQAWTNLFADEDYNGVMEFAGPEHKQAPGRWSRELNFLAWQPLGGKAMDLPAGLRLRISLQWREPHDADYFHRPGEEDFYRKPLADLRLELLRQRDPQAKTLAADVFEVAGRSLGWAQRLEHLPIGSVYEQSLEVTLAQGGSYAVRIHRPRSTAWARIDGEPPRFVYVQGLTATGIRPRGAPTLEALERQWELKPRLFIQAIDDKGRRGRPIFGDFWTEAGALLLPGDGRNVVTVAAADWHGNPQPTSANGPPAFVELARKPSLLAYDQVVAAQGPAIGASLANAFAAGAVACMVSSGMTREQVSALLDERQGQVLVVPAKK